MKKVVCLIYFLLLCTACTQQQDKAVYLGAGPGLPRMLADAFAKEWQALGHEIVQNSGTIDIQTVADCCATVSQWALASRKLDMSIMCPDAARRLVQENKDYVILGAVVLGGDILVRRKEQEVNLQKIGVAQLRDVQEKLVDTLLGNAVHTINMHPSALPYALERGAIDAIVLDRLVVAQSSLALCMVNSEHIEETKNSISQVLVVHKRLLTQEKKQALAEALYKAVNIANEQLLNIKPLDLCTVQEDKHWTKILTKFVSPLAFP